MAEENSTEKERLSRESLTAIYPRLYGVANRSEQSQALPSMYETPNFLAWALQEFNGKAKTGALPFRENFLLPYLNLGTLQTDSNKLFALLHVRTAFEPTDWTLWDRNQTNGGWLEGLFEVQFSDCFVNLYSTSNYGDIVPCDVEKAHRWDICAFPRAKIILEAQCLLMRLLRVIVQLILEGTQGESGNLKWIQLKDTGFRG